MKDGRLWTLVSQVGDIALWRADDGMGAVTRIYGHQVQSMGPDCPAGGGRWWSCAGACGVSYVARPVAWCAARERFRHYTQGELAQ